MWTWESEIENAIKQNKSSPKCGTLMTVICRGKYRNIIVGGFIVLMCGKTKNFALPRKEKLWIFVRSDLFIAESSFLIVTFTHRDTHTYVNDDCVTNIYICLFSLRLRLARSNTSLDFCTCGKYDDAKSQDDCSN